MSVNDNANDTIEQLPAARRRLNNLGGAPGGSGGWGSGTRLMPVSITRMTWLPLDMCVKFTVTCWDLTRKISLRLMTVTRWARTKAVRLAWLMLLPATPRPGCCCCCGWLPAFGPQLKERSWCGGGG